MTLGRVADRFTLLAEVGRGGVGTIYRARDDANGELVALKLLCEVGDEERSRFEEEARALRALDHPGIVRYVADGVDVDARPYLAMEWLAGEDLETRLSRGPLGPTETLVLARRVAAALAFTHERGLLHRDIKPANLFIPGGDLERVKLVDFGLARGARAKKITASGFMVGTPGYMAPEHLRGERIDARADVFALGCVLYQCLSGRPPFGRGAAMAMISRALLEEPPPLAPDTPQPLVDLVARLLSKERAERPRDGSAVVAELADVSTHEAGPPSAPSTPSARSLGAVLFAGWAPGAADQAEAFATTVDAGLAARLVAAAGAWGAHIEATVARGFVATFPRASSVEAQALDAARCALALSSTNASVRVSVAMVRGGRDAVGRAIDEVSRPHAGHAVRVDALIASLLPSRFEREPIDADGFALIAERDALDVARPVLGRATRFVGREKELADVALTSERWFLRAEAGAITITGEAGVGKSRLRQEALRALAVSVPRLAIWTGRGDPSREGAPLALLSAMIRRIASLEGRDAAADRERLLSRVRLFASAADAPRIARFLGEITGVAFEEDTELAAARRDRVLMGDQMRRAFVDLVDAETRSRPLLVVLEDAQWGDLASLSFVAAALAAWPRRPLGVWLVGRASMSPRLSGAFAASRPLAVELASLDDAAARALVANALGRDDATVSELLALGARNPLVLEELVRAKGEGASAEGTLEAMREARLSLLGSDALRVLRAAALVGTTFWRGALSAALPDMPARELDGAIGELARREWIVRHPNAKYHGEEELAFAHPGLRDTVDGRVSAAERARGHAAIARWLEGRGEPDASVIAFHLHLAGRSSAAADHFARAAQRALVASDFAAAREHARRGLLATPGAEVRGRLDLYAAQADRWLGDNGAALEHADLAMSALRAPRGAQSERWFEAAGEAMAAASRLRKLPRMAELATELEATTSGLEPTDAQVVAIARAATLLSHAHVDVRAAPLFAWLEAIAPKVADQPHLVARIAMAHAWRAQTSGDWLGYRAALLRALEGFDLAGDARGAAVTRANCAHASLELGDFESCVTLASRALVDADATGGKAVIAVAENNLGMALGYLGRLDEALAHERRAVETYRDLGDERLEGASRIYLATIHALAGDLAEAEREARRAVLLLATVPPLSSVALAKLSEVLGATGRDAEALVVAEQATEALALAQKIEGDASQVLLSHGEALARVGRARESAEALARARAELDAQSAKIVDPAARARFLEAIPHHARLVALTRGDTPRDTAR